MRRLPVWTLQRRAAVQVSKQGQQMAGQGGALVSRQYEGYSHVFPPFIIARPCIFPGADVVTSIVHADDVVPRLTVENFARMLEELASPNCQAAAEELPAALSVIQHLRALRRCNSVISSANSEAADAALRGAAGELRQQADAGGGGRTALVRVNSTEFSGQKYHAHVPGRIIYMHRQPGSGRGVSDAEAREEAGKDVAAKLVDCRHPVLMHIRLTSRLVLDHFIVPDLGPGFCAALDALAGQAGTESAEQADGRCAATHGGLDAAAIAEAGARAEQLRGSSPASFPLSQASFMPPASHALT